MLDLFEALPLVLDGVVVLQIEVGLRVLDAVVVQHIEHGAADDRRHAAVQIGRLDRDQSEVDDGRVLDRFEQADQRGGGQLALRLLDSPRDGGEADADADGFILLVEDDGDVLEVDDQLERRDDLRLHALGEGDGAVEVLVALVDDLEEAVAVLLDEVVDVLRFAEVEVIALHDEIRHLLHGAVVVLGRIDLAFRPVDLLLIAQPLDQPAVVLSVVLFLKGGELVEALDEQTLALQIGEAERPADGVHALGDRPFLDRGEELLCDLGAVDRVEAVEAHTLLMTLLVGCFLDDALNTSDDPLAVEGEEVYDLTAIVVGEIGLEHRLFVAVEGWNEVGVILI